MKSPTESQPAAPHRGPRGGRSTLSSDGSMIRKNFYLDREVEEALRDDAHRRRRSEADVLREILRDHYGIRPTRATR